MPDFDEIYPVGESVELFEEEDELIFADTPRKCAECGTVTHWTSINAHAFLCSTECYTQYWKNSFSTFYKTS